MYVHIHYCTARMQSVTSTCMHILVILYKNNLSTFTITKIHTLSLYATANAIYAITGIKFYKNIQ